MAFRFKTWISGILAVCILLFGVSSVVFVNKAEAKGSSGEPISGIVKIRGNTAIDKNGVLWVWKNDEYLAEPLFKDVQDAYQDDNEYGNQDENIWMIVKKDGTVWTKGKYYEYFLNDNGDYDSKPYLRANLEQVSGLPKIVAVDQNYALDEAGNVWRINIAKLTAEKMPSLKNIVSLDASMGNTVFNGALDKDGNVWAWEFTGIGRKVLDPFVFRKNIMLLSGGIAIDSSWKFYNIKAGVYDYKHGGDGISTAYNISSYRNEIKAISGQDQEMGNDYSLVLKKDGTIWTWSGHEYGTNKPVKLVQIKGPSSAKSLSAKEHGGTILHQDGTVSSWNYKEVGYEKYLTKVQPVQVTKKIKIEVNGTLIDLPAPPRMYEGSVYIPVRGLIEYLGGSVAYAKDKVTAKYKDHVLELTLWSKLAIVDGTTTTINAPAIILNGNTMIPLRFTGQAIGSEVAWDAQAQTVRLSLPTGK